jgi:hypothetical protein
MSRLSSRTTVCHATDCQAASGAQQPLQEPSARIAAQQAFQRRAAELRLLTFSQLVERPALRRTQEQQKFAVGAAPAWGPQAARGPRVLESLAAARGP